MRKMHLSPRAATVESNKPPRRGPKFIDNNFFSARSSQTSVTRQADAAEMGGFKLVRIVRAWWLAALLLAGAAQASAEFKQSDLEKMVTEIVAVMPQDPKLVYPVKCSIVKDDQVNA